MSTFSKSITNALALVAIGFGLSVGAASAQGFGTSQLQEMLVWTGDYDGMIDGQFGDGTRQAIRSFQSRMGHAPTGSLTDLLGCGTLNDVPFYAVNGSGLTDATIDLNTVDFTDCYVATAVFGYATGDKFTFSTTCSEDGRFQTFLRNAFGKVTWPFSDTVAVILFM